MIKKRTRATTAKVECIYTPTVETYIFDSVLTTRAEKVLILKTESETSIAYVAVDLWGHREIYDPSEHEYNEVFTLTPDHCVPNGELDGFMFGIKDEYQEHVLHEVVAEFKEWNVDHVKRMDGSVVSIDDFVNEYNGSSK